MNDTAQTMPLWVLYAGLAGLLSPFVYIGVQWFRQRLRGEV